MTVSFRKFSEDNEFTEGQNKALEGLKTFVETPNLMSASLIGAAGTGKTYILKHFLKNIFKGVSCVTAPTHKAVRIVEQLLGRKGETLQALHGLRPNTELASFNLDNVIFDPRADAKIQNYKLVIIDEASQVNRALHELNMTRAKAFNVKLIYVGDKYQLPPIKEESSITLNQKVTFNLTEIVRQEQDNPLMELLIALREDIEFGTIKFEKLIGSSQSKVIDNKGYCLYRLKDFQQELVSEFKSDSFSKNIEYTRYLAWTNADILDKNIYVRNTIFNNKDVLDKTDLLTAYSSILDEFGRPVIINSEDYTIDAIRDHTNDFGIDTYVVNLRSVFSKNAGGSLQIVNHKAATFGRYWNYLNNLHINALKASASNRKVKWAKYYQFKNAHLSMINFDLDYGPVKKDIDYGFGMTVHKSQGSTFENVFVSLQDINKCKDRILRKKLLYVALSRAKNKAVILI